MRHVLLEIGALSVFSWVRLDETDCSVDIQGALQPMLSADADSRCASRVDAGAYPEVTSWHPWTQSDTVLS